MPTSTATRTDIERREIKAHSICPACNGLMVRHGNDFRCTRCAFRLCEGCEPDQMPCMPESED